MQNQGSIHGRMNSSHINLLYVTEGFLNMENQGSIHRTNNSYINLLYYVTEGF